MRGYELPNCYVQVPVTTEQMWTDLAIACEEAEDDAEGRPVVVLWKELHQDGRQVLQGLLMPDRHLQYRSQQSNYDYIYRIR